MSSATVRTRVRSENDWVDDLGLKTSKEARRKARHHRDQVRLIDGWEQYRTLWDGIDFKRQIINMGDKKVRFALVIMGALNAVLLIVLTRGPVVRVIPEGVRIWLAILLVIYGIVTFLFMAHAIEALRPRPEARQADNAEWRSREFGPGGAKNPRPVGLFIRGELSNLSFEEERKLWSEARLCDVNAELILFNRSSSVILTNQLKQLSKVYQGLKILTILAAIMLALLVGTGVVKGGQDATAPTADLTAALR